MKIDFRYQTIKKKVVTSINIDFRKKSIMIDLRMLSTTHSEEVEH